MPGLLAFCSGLEQKPFHLQRGTGHCALPCSA